MMKKILILFMSIIFIGAMTSGARAVTIDLFDWGYNIDGTIYLSPGTYAGPSAGQLAGSGIDDSGFSYSSSPGSGGGFGSIIVSFNTIGAHSVDFFVDHEIDEDINGWINEYGATNGSVAAGQSWEIDEPGWLFGDIFDNFIDSDLDNTNAIPLRSKEDVSMALGWDFLLGAGETAEISFILSDLVVPSGFFLTQTDPDSSANIYFSSSIKITSAPIPEPTTIALLGIGIAGLAGGAARRKWKKQALDKS